MVDSGIEECQGSHRGYGVLALYHCLLVVACSLSCPSCLLCNTVPIGAFSLSLSLFVLVCLHLHLFIVAGFTCTHACLVCLCQLLPSFVHAALIHTCSVYVHLPFAGLCSPSSACGISLCTHTHLICLCQLFALFVHAAIIHTCHVYARPPSCWPMCTLCLASACGTSL